MPISWLSQILSRNAIIFVFVLLVFPPLNYHPAVGGGRAKLFKLDNGLRVVVVPDHRAALVTHSIWYRAGASDDPPGQTGLAHFVEHLMFKDTETPEAGSFSQIVARLGGEDDGATERDTTYYYQSIASAHLRRIMELEAKRMARLTPDEAAVETEREVVLEELTSDPVETVFEDRMRAVLYVSHPYRRPVIGWPKEVANLSREQALAFHRRYYTPDNAIVVVVGDVTVDAVKAIATQTYGRVWRKRKRVSYKPRYEPPPRVARRIEMRDARVGRPVFGRLYLGARKITAARRTAAALQVLIDILAVGPNSRLHRSLVIQQKIATHTDGAFLRARRDYSEISISAEVADGHSLTDIEAAVDRVIAQVVAHGVSPDELERSKRRHRANHVFQSDSQQTLAERYGINLITGMAISGVEEWPHRIGEVTAADILAVARKYLHIRRSVTGFLKPLVSKAKSQKTSKKQLPPNLTLVACP